MPAPALNPRHLRRVALRVLAAAFLAAGGLAVSIPFIWMLVSSLKSPADLLVYPPVLIPRALRFQNYLDALYTARFGLYALNSFIYAASVTISTLVLCSMAGYALARLQFRGSTPIFIAILATMMVPEHVRLIPVYAMLRSFPFAGGNDWRGVGGSGLLDTFPGLILPAAVSAFGIFLMRQFFLTLPKELDEAARIDGASEYAIYWRIAMPLSRPALAALGILTFQWTWNNFVWPLILTSSDHMRTLQLGLQVFQDTHNTQWELLMAGTVMATAPLILAFIPGQRWFIRGIAMTGIKG